MADAFWRQLGGNPCFVLQVGGQIVGITYWVDAEAIGRGVSEQSPTPAESGWYFVAVTRPRDPERVAQGLEIRRDMPRKEMAQIAQNALEVVSNEVLAGGGG
jgi:hypothetical protein